MDLTPVLLSAYDAKRCARRIHNEWDPALPRVEREVPVELQLRFDAGDRFEEMVLDELGVALGSDRMVDLREVQGRSALIAATVRAMDAGVLAILGGWLPDDEVGARKGRPDVLLRMGERDGGASYVPGDVKAHLITAKSAKGEVAYSLPSDPATIVRRKGLAVRTSARFDDYLQLAHYWRMLEAMGRAPDQGATGFIIGTDRLTALAATGHVLTWLDLEKSLFLTYSRSRGRAKRTALERYDHEQGFRVKVATAAGEGEQALVQPIFVDECNGCAWFDHCLQITGSDVASAAITSGRLSRREWSALARAGVRTLTELADVDLDEPAFQAAYLPEVSDATKPLDRLAAAVRRARMIRAGVTIERETTGRIEVPRADVEIDLDIEWDVDTHVYLWGALVSRPGEPPAYHPILAFDPLDIRAEIVLAQKFAAWLRHEIHEADSRGHTLLIYHYSPAELTHLERLLGAEAAADLTVRCIDLYPIVKQHFFGLRGLGIKQVAPTFGFNWRDEDPGGLQSQLWLIEARDGPDVESRAEARARILAYNEDDVLATAAVRRGLSQPGGDKVRL